jgi:hypothetical protein
MKWLAVFLTLILYLAPAAAQPQDMPTDQRNAVKKLVTFYENLGDSETAKKLQDGLNDGSIKFGPTPDGDNAAIDMKTKKININPAIVKGVNSSDLDSWRATADLASTVSHELTHKGQDKWAWHASYWKEKAGYGNACEQEAWSGTLEKVADWVRRVKNELDSKHNRSVREQAEAAKRLEMMCQAFEVLRNDYVGEKGKIGDLQLTDSVGIPISLDQLLAEVEATKNEAQKLIGNANVSVRSFDGTYDGSFQGKGTGRIAFKIQGFTVSGKISGDYQGEPCNGSVTGRIDADGMLSLSLDGAITSGNKKYPFTGNLTGRISNGKAAGDWFASNQYGKPSGSWSAAK